MGTTNATSTTYAHKFECSSVHFSESKMFFCFATKFVCLMALIIAVNSASTKGKEKFREMFPKLVMTAKRYLENPNQQANYHGAIAIQIRKDVNKDWSFSEFNGLNSYKKGFEDRPEDTDAAAMYDTPPTAYWAGLDALHEITKKGRWELVMYFQFSDEIGGGAASSNTT